MSGYIVETEQIACGLYFRINYEKTLISIVLNHDGRVHIWIPSNTENSKKESQGKVFSNIELALANYKKQFIKDAILIAVDIWNEKHSYSQRVH